MIILQQQSKLGIFYHADNFYWQLEINYCVFLNEALKIHVEYR